MSASVAVETLRSYPELVAVVAVVMYVLRAWQATLSWREYRAVHRLKRALFPLFDRAGALSGTPYVGRVASVADLVLWVSDKGGRDDAEYDMTTPGSIREVVRDFEAAGAERHLLCSIKRRPRDFAPDADVTGDPLTDAHVVWPLPQHDEQVEAYLFRNDDGTVDVYVHTEADVTDPIAHLVGEQKDGDGYGVVPEQAGDDGEKETAA